MAEDGQKAALDRIAKSRELQSTDLDLSDLALAELPTEIWSLTQLQWLSLANNQLTALPPEITGLTQLGRGKGVREEVKGEVKGGR